jgi:hypothetical protein
MSKADPNAKAVAFVGIVGAVSVFLVVILLQIVFYRMQENETARKVLSAGPQELAQLEAQQGAELTGYAWVDEANGVARIPIERAMELTVDTLNDPPPPVEPEDEPESENEIEEEPGGQE